jgi:hypothetical protein
MRPSARRSGPAIRSSDAQRSTVHHRENPATVNHTIFDGTGEIQQLVIARAISGMRIE